MISRSLSIIVGSKADHELLKPIAPYKPKKRLTLEPELTVVEGIAPPSLKAIPYCVPLPFAEIPDPLSSVLSRGTFAETLRQLRNMYLPSSLNSSTYSRHFKHLLWIEEFRME